MLLGLLMALTVFEAKAENPTVEIRKQFTAAELNELPDLFKQNSNSHYMSVSDAKGLTLKGIYLKGSAKGRWRIMFAGYGGNFAYFRHYINTLNLEYGDHIIALNPLGQGQEAFLSIEKSCNCLEPQGKIEDWDHLVYQTQLITQAIYQFNAQKKVWLEGQSLGNYILRGYLLGIAFNNDGVPRVDKNAALNIKKMVAGVILHQPVKFIDIALTEDQRLLYNKIEVNLPKVVQATKKYAPLLKKYPNASAKILYYVSNFLVTVSSTIDSKMREMQHPDNLGKTGMRDSFAYGFSFQIPEYIKLKLSENLKKMSWESKGFNYNQQQKIKGRFLVPVQYRPADFDTLNIASHAIEEAQFMHADHVVMKNMGHGDIFSEVAGPLNAKVTIMYSDRVENKK